MRATVLEKDFVAFSSGGTAGLCYLGAITALEEALGGEYAAWHDALRGVAGTSAGAIAALVLLLNIQQSDRHRILGSIDTLSFLMVHDLSTLTHQYGLGGGNEVTSIIHALLHAGGLSTAARMRDIQRYTRKTFTVVATNLSEKRVEHISSETHPLWRVDQAVVASCSVPLIFRPVRCPTTRHVFVDGALLESMPCVFEMERTVFLSVHRDLDGDPLQSFPTFIHSILALVCRNADLRAAALIHVRPSDRSSLDFTITPQDIALMMRPAYASVYATLRRDVSRALGQAALSLVGTAPISHDEAPP